MGQDGRIIFYAKLKFRSITLAYFKDAHHLEHDLLTPNFRVSTTNIKHTIVYFVFIHIRGCKNL